jgi:hypothetical protein
VALRSDGRHVAAGCFDGAVRVWDVAAGRALVTLVSSGATDWLALTPEGYVAASEPLRKAGTWRGRQPPAGDVWAVLHKPDLVAKAWRGDKIPEPSLPSPKR